MVEAEGARSTDGRSTRAVADVRAGLRSYRTVVRRIVRYHGGGVTAGYSQYDFKYESTQAEHTFRSGGGGVYAELGAEYLITQHLSLGANTSASVTVRGFKQDTGGGGTTGFGWGVAAGGVRVFATLYF